jgi:photosystem II stability/assembly factor-like uncharacterized protein
MARKEHLREDALNKHTTAMWIFPMVGFVVVFNAFAGACNSIEPDQDSWESLGLEGQWVLSFAETPWGLFAGTRSTGVYKQNASSWEAVGVTESAVAALLFIHNPTERLIAGVHRLANETTPAAAFATTDGGETWVPWDDQLAEMHDSRFWTYSLAEDPTTPGRLFLGSSASILRSDDGGATWRFVFNTADASGPGIHSVAVEHGGASVWAGGGSALGVGRIIHSSDTGETWRVLFPAQFAEFPVRAVLVDPLNPNRIWAGMWGTANGASVIWSEDQGETWVPSLTEPVLISDLVEGPNSLYAIGGRTEPADGFPAGLYVYRYNGGRWTRLPTPPEIAWGLSAIVTSDGYLVVGTAGSGVWRAPISTVD